MILYNTSNDAQWHKYIFSGIQSTVHSRMRRQSSALVTATDKTSGIGVLFDVDHDVIVRKRCFQRCNILKFQKNFKNFFCSNFGAVPWSSDFSSTN